jgi:ADP-ribose pyrophosphatase YjhB (NUDIX family)
MEPPTTQPPHHTLFRLSEPLVRAWWRVSRGVTLGARVVAVDEAGRIALVRHVYKPGWHFPGGGVERGERAADAARRELQEEAHAVPEAPLLLLGVYANFAEHPGDHLLLYRTRARSLGPRRSDQEIAEVGWFAPDETPAGATPGTRRRIAELYDGAPPSADW